MNYRQIPPILRDEDVTATTNNGRPIYISNPDIPYSMTWTVPNYDQATQLSYTISPEEEAYINRTIRELLKDYKIEVAEKSTNPVVTIE